MTHDNPYQSPATVSNASAMNLGKLSLGQKAFAATLIVLTIPATLIAFYVTCVGAGWGSAIFVFDPLMRGSGFDTYAFIWPSFILGIAAGLIAGYYTVYGMYRWIKFVTRLPKTMEEDETQEPRT